MNDAADLATLKVKVEHLEGAVEKMSGKLDEVHSVLLGARAIKWFVLMVAGLIGFFGGDKISHWLGKL